MNQGGPNGETDGIVKSIEAGAREIRTPSACISPAIGATQRRSTPTIRPSTAARTWGTVNGQNNNIRDLTFRLRTKPNTAPGKYSVTFLLETNGQKKTGNLRVHRTAAGNSARAAAADR